MRFKPSAVKRVISRAAAVAMAVALAALAVGLPGCQQGTAADKPADAKPSCCPAMSCCEQPAVAPCCAAEGAGPQMPVAESQLAADAPKADPVQPAAEKPADKPAAAAPTDKPAAEQPKWRDLLDGKSLEGWKATNFGGEGKVEVDEGTVVMEIGNDMTGITCTAEIPRDNFELALEAMRIEGGDFFASTTFPVGKGACTLVVGGWGGTIVGLSSIDGYDASENPTTKFMDFKDKRWYKVRIRVSGPRIEAWIDKEQVVSQERADHKFDTRMECEQSKPLGVCTWRTKGAVRNIRLRELSADEIKAAQEKKVE